MRRGMKYMLAVLLGLVIPGGALAAPTTAGSSPKIKNLQVAVKHGPQGKKTFVFKKIDLFGKIHRPSAYYLLSRAKVSYHWTRMQEDFLPRIPASVSKRPF